MAHPTGSEAGDAPVTDVSSAATALRNLDLQSLDDGAKEPNEDPAEEPAAQQPEADDIGDDDLEAEGGEQEGEEPESPAIDAPASLNAEEKARYAKLQPDAQELIAEIETRRNTQVQQATTKAANAQREAEQRAAEASAQAKAVYANQLKAFADQLAPQRPDHRLAQTDPATFIAMNAQYDAAKAQHDEFVQQVQALADDADTEMTQAEVTDRDRRLMEIPEVQNPETRETFFTKAIEAATNLGLDTKALNRATAGEWQALRQVSAWKEKAEKYDAAMSRKMQRVRSAKPAMKPGAAQPINSGNRKAYTDASTRLRSTGSVDDAAAALKAIL